MQRGRKSAANVVSLAPTAMRSKLTVPSVLTSTERKLYVELVTHNPHLTPTDVPLLTGYVQALALMQKLVKRADIAGWERAGRMALALARSLRLTQRSVDAKTVARSKQQLPPSYYETMEADDD